MIASITLWLSMLSFIVVVCLSGYAIMKILVRFVPLPLTDRFIFAFPAGGWGIAWLLFCGHFFLRIPISPPVVYGILLLFAAAGGIWGVRDIRPLRGTLFRRSSPPDRWNWPAWGLLAVLLLLSCRYVLLGLVTPIEDGDAQGYHLPYTKYIYQTHALPEYADPSMFSSGFSYPPLMFIFYAMEWIWIDAVHMLFTRMMILIMTGFTIILLYRTARQVLQVSPPVALGVGISLLLPGGYLEVLSLYQSSTDIPLAFWGLALCYFLALDLREGICARMLFIGVCGAMGCWNKPFGYVFGAVCIGVMGLSWAVARLRQSDAWSYGPRPIIGLCAVWGITIAPYLMRNWAYWGNPFYPGFGDIFGGYLIDDWSMEHTMFFFAGSFPLFYEWREILVTVWAQPGFAVAGLAILHPGVYGRSDLRTIWLVTTGFFLFYLVKFGSPQGYLDHQRYLIIAYVCMTLFTGIFLDRRFYTGIRGVIVLSGAVLLQGLRWFLRDAPALSFTGLSAIKLLAYDYFPVLLVLGFLAIELFFRTRPAVIFRLRLLMVAGACILLTGNWPLSKPWRLVTQPLVTRPELVNWTEIRLPEPYGPWMRENLPGDAVLLIRWGRRWIIPRQMVDAYSPLLKELHDPDLPVGGQMELLARLGVTHVCEGTMNFGGFEPLKFSCWPDLDRVPFLKKIYAAPVANSNDHVTVYEVVYPPELQRLLASPLPRPWLFKGAAVGVLN